MNDWKEKIAFKGDKILWYIVIMLMIASVMVVYSSTGRLAYNEKAGNTFFYLIKQLFLIGGCFGVMFIVQSIHYRYFYKYAGVLLFVSMILLVCAAFGGTNINGAGRWIRLPLIGLTFQPSELAKIVLILFFARFFSKHAENLNTVKTIGLSFVLIGIPLLLIVKQPDTSTSIAIALIFISLLFIAGLSYKIVLTVLGICIPTGLIGITVILRMAQFSGDYRFGRIMAWLYPQDPRWSDIAAQQQNSIMAIGSGQLWGKGLNNSAATSMKNANYIIEPQTDFIFAVAGEELGFIGTMVIVLLLLFIVIECILIARKAKDLAGRLICCGMAALIGFQSIFNIFVATGLMPNTGIPLPFVSYGLTSLLSLYLGMGFVLNVGLQPKKY